VTGKVIKSTTAQKIDTGDKVRQLALQLILLSASISVGLGFVNLMPIPVLDGGHLAFYAYEAVARRPAGPKFQMASFRVGLALVVCLMLFANWNDLQRMQAFKFLGGLFS
jgi:regulator of sigma E protease